MFRRKMFAPLGARTLATYGVTLLSHDEVVRKFGPQAKGDILQLLESVEKKIFSWRLCKWEGRVPVLQQKTDKLVAEKQLSILKMMFLDRAKTSELIEQDLSFVGSELHLTKNEVRQLTRFEMQEKVADLRWKGEIQKAKAVREAFLRLEQYGARDFQFFERLSAVYGLGKLGTFDRLFDNTASVNEEGTVLLGSCSEFGELVGLTVSKFPMIDIIHDFLGLNVVEGYRSSLRQFLALGLHAKNNTEFARGSRLLFNNENESLLDFADSCDSIANNSLSQGVPDFVYICGGDITLITIASPNRWLRARQLPHRKQMEGIARRASLSRLLDYNQVRIRNLFLPPEYIDRPSLDRLVRALNLPDEFAPWVSIYDKQLSSTDQDYASLSTPKSDEEWVKL